MRVFVYDRTVRCAVVFRPLLFYMDECPLAAAEFEVLQAGELEEVLVLIDHPIRVQVTPEGRCVSSTLTV